MPPRVKRGPKNAFTFFLENYIEKQRKMGRNVSMRIGAEECGPLWRDLPSKEKQKFYDMAAAVKVLKKTDKEHKYTTTGVSYAEMERRENELKRKIEAADLEVKMTVLELDAGSLKTQLFYIVHCNYYCRTNRGLYVPGEIAIAEFNLQDGIRDTFHRLINPGGIPFGYAYEASESIKEVHGLPYPPFEEGESDYGGLRDQILKFIEPAKLKDGSYPPLYTIENNLEASEFILSHFNNGFEEENFFRVYLLYKMFYWLKNKCVEQVDAENIGFPVMSNAESELNRDVFRYAPGISCSFHLASEDKYHNCSLSFVKRMCYLICDHCCQHIGVDLIPGKHCRSNADLEGGISLPAKPKTTKEIPSSSSSSRMSVAGCSSVTRSSYAKNFHSLGLKKEHPGTFLHEELESSFGILDLASAVSRPSRTPSAFGIGPGGQQASTSIGSASTSIGSASTSIESASTSMGSASTSIGSANASIRSASTSFGSANASIRSASTSIGIANAGIRSASTQGSSVQQNTREYKDDKEIFQRTTTFGRGTKRH